MPKRTPMTNAAPITPLTIPAQVRTVVVYGGSFDPPHFYHTVGPLSAVARLFGPSGWIVYIPAASSPHKPNGPIASDAHRLAMLKLGLDLPGPRSIWTDELDRAAWARARAREQGVKVPQASYTVDTLRRLRAILPKRVTLRLLIGSDQLAKFHTWKEPREIVELAEPLIMPREPVTMVTSMYSALDHDFWTREEKAAWCQRVAPTFPLDAASTDVRQLIPGAPRNAAAWERRKGLNNITASVAQYIIDHNLYGFRPGKAKPATPIAAPKGDAPGQIERVIASAERVLVKEMNTGKGKAREAQVTRQ
jgi:nicotinate-nucleotide adenylyltransferase